MKYSKWIGLAGAVLLVIAAFMPWVTIQSQQLVISGVEATGTNYGKPAYFHFLLLPFFLTFIFLPRLWAKRWNLFIIALNTAWILKNFLVIGTCKGGECPVRETGFYLMLLWSPISGLKRNLRNKKTGSNRCFSQGRFTHPFFL